jgi:hypothetical protein
MTSQFCQTQVNETTAWGLSHAGHRFVSADGSSKVEPSMAHSRYKPVAPGDIAPKLEAAGYVVTTEQSGFTGRGQAIVTATSRKGFGGYSGQCHILLDHTGRASVKLQGGVLRVCCANAFFAPAFRFHHCGEELRAFVNHPEAYVERVILDSWQTASRVEGLRGDRRGEWLMRAFRAERPKLGARAVAAFQSYQYQDDGHPSAWAFVQALTAVRDRRGRKVRALENIASRVVDTLSRGAPVLPELFASKDFN